MQSFLLCCRNYLSQDNTFYLLVHVSHKKKVLRLHSQSNLSAALLLHVGEQRRRASSVFVPLPIQKTAVWGFVQPSILTHVIPSRSCSAHTNRSRHQFYMGMSRRFESAVRHDFKVWFCRQSAAVVSVCVCIKAQISWIRGMDALFIYNLVARSASWL